MTGRHAGLLVPLFSVASSKSWGIGEIPDLVSMGDWLVRSGLDRLMLLPLGTMPEGETSPYSAASTMAIDPIYIAVGDVEDFHRAGGVEALPPAVRQHLERARAAPAVNYADVRRAKAGAIDLAFERFLAAEWLAHSDRARDLAAFIERERWWLDDYALFQAMVARWPGVSWRAWPPPVRDRHGPALAEVHGLLSRSVLREQYVQWIADGQWQRARKALAARGIAVVGDLPFVAARESADVWSRADEYLLDVSVGAPPDAFSEEGQDWQLPGYRWHAIAASGYALIRARARRVAELFDGIRIDHLVGLYRTYNRPTTGEPYFVPEHEDEQVRQGEAVLTVFRESGATLIAEDLGTVPDFVRESMARLDVPGTKVLRWERKWLEPGQPFIDPRLFPEASAAMTGTHDTTPLASWWDEAPLEERWAALQLPALAASGERDPGQAWSDRLRDALLTEAWFARSRELFVPPQDIFGWRDRINVPGEVNGSNWTWRLPWPVDRLCVLDEPVRRADFLRALSRAAGRWSDRDFEG